MAKFKVGDKVRVKGGAIVAPEVIGKNGVIVREGVAADWIVKIRGTHFKPELAPELMPDEWPCMSADLEPILPERDAAFEEFMRKITEYVPQKLTPAALDRVRGGSQ